MQNKNFLKTEVFRDWSLCIALLGVLFTLVMVMPIFASARASLIFLSTLFGVLFTFTFPVLLLYFYGTRPAIANTPQSWGTLLGR